MLRTPLERTPRLIGALIASLFVSGSALARQAPPADAPSSPPVASDDRTPRRDRASRDQPLPPDWPRAGGFGGPSERPMIESFVAANINENTRGRREFTDDDVMRAIEVAKEVSPSWGQALEARAQEDMEQLKSALRGRARRLLELLALKERAPLVYQAKITELRAQAETSRAAAELRAAEGDAAGAPDKVRQLRAALDEAARKQVEATLAARRAELVALDERLTQLRGNLEADAKNAAQLELQVKDHVKDHVKAQASTPRDGGRGADRDGTRKPLREPAREDEQPAPRE